ncbi:hypothetical protein MPTK1_3g04340 [Marchantia polymorpha subsp. ruderalis]|uniref:MSP domain-containing protein n=2 Tax=Marchantia polymorpha TaxID=3197 RepID=A0A176WLE5_MARPO|nr:hypothetical protein AXG93_3005s1240 [Marchantia polymorpha subsp. ruderalis]PTQ43995.1 hypothetical protein MARPO_0022s0097 [Marchantia polymorpha]BBN04409.1 hypothetical protein Mp_3g04340 [Marchantia polymorpha subsp. ruderalis]|eukprot:PTQ43995.1 hypothetical protein MARPO_0022s0097 [Marchantia polymorpha]
MPGERELLSIQPGELKFPFELKKQISCSLRLVNATDNFVAFKVKTTSPKKYCVRPNTGLVLPQSSSDVTVTMQAQREAPPDMQCKDKFLVQSVCAPVGTSAKDVSQELFSKESGKEIHEAKLRVLYVAPPQPPSPVAESAEEGLSPKAISISDNGDRHFLSHDANSKDVNEMKAKLTELRASLSTLTLERNSALELSQRLQQELTNMVAVMDKRNAGKGSSQAVKGQQSQGFSFLFVFIVGILGILVGYFMSP